MLILARGVGEEIVIDGGITIRVLEAKHRRARLGVTAPKEIGVNRSEVAEARAREDVKLADILTPDQKPEIRDPLGVAEAYEPEGKLS